MNMNYNMINNMETFIKKIEKSIKIDMLMKLNLI